MLIQNLHVEHVNNADNLDIVMLMYNLIEYYSDTSGSLWQFKRDEQNMNNGNSANVTKADSSSFKYKSSFFETLEDDDNGVFKNVKIAVPLKYLSNFWRSLEMPLINCKIYFELNGSKDCVMSTIAATTFKITNTKLYVPIVTLSSKDNVKLVKLLEEGFEKPAYWNEYQTKIETRDLDNNNLTRFLLDASFQGVKRLFVPAFDNTDGDTKQAERSNHRKYLLPRVNITNYNVLIDGRNFYDQLINDLIKQCNEIRKIATGQEDDYTTGCSLDYQYFKDHYNLIAIDLSRQIPQIEFYGMLKTNSPVCTVLEKSKQTVLQFSKGTTKVL